jgi:NADH:ubiquinone oxidoreductase subunit 5 (subunit L)/multisubunit Na+/H+ antiporter MnhA subunit
MTAPLLPTDPVAVLVAWQLIAPAAALAAIGLPALVGRPLGERPTTRIVAAAFFSCFVAALVVLAVLVRSGFDARVVHLGRLFEVGHHTASIDLVADGLSVPYVCFSTGLCSLVNAFAGKYLHREPGFVRFFILLALFGTGMNLMVLAGSIDALFAGWEFLGISSALLIGFFHERRNAVDAAIRAFVTYRVCDVGLFGASVVIHRATGTGDFTTLFAGAWPHATCLVDGRTAGLITLLIAFAALGKSAQVPFSGWLPRAMEGPTPSSAIFYGALSIHAGAYVLLRCESLLDAAPLTSWLLVLVGAGTAVHGAIVGSVQTDLKSGLAYSSMTQAGLILAEIGLGLRILPLVHVCSHAVLRSLQILRSPSAMHDRHELAAALGGPPGRPSWSIVRLLPRGFERHLYHLALERGFEETLVARLIVRPLLAVLMAADRGERRWIERLGGGHGAGGRHDAPGGMP